MIYHAITMAFTCFLLLIGEPESPELIPVESGVADRGSLSSSLRVEQVDFRQDHAFERLYRVKGSSDIYVRKSGGLTAIFRSSEYVKTSSGDIPIVPAGTEYCIGEIPQRLLKQIDELQEPLPAPDSMIQAQIISIDESNRVFTKERTYRSIKFLENESYRRKRLASFVLEIAILN
jgi:hypothetical protein